MSTPTIATIRGQPIDPLREWTGGSGHAYTGPCDMLDVHGVACRGTGRVDDGERSFTIHVPVGDAERVTVHLCETCAYGAP